MKRRAKQWLIFSLLCCILFTFGGCNISGATEPASNSTADNSEATMDIRGTVTEVHPADIQSGNAGEILGAILIQGTVEEDMKFDQASVTIKRNSVIVQQSGTERQPATFADIVVGKRVEVRFAGAVMETYPVQGTAAELVIFDH